MQDVVQLEVGLQLRFIEGVARLAHLLRNRSPNPTDASWKPPFSWSIDRLHVGGFLARVRHRRRREFAEQLIHRRRRLRRLVFELISRVVRVAEQGRAFRAQPRDARGRPARLSHSPPWLLRASEAFMIRSRSGAIFRAKPAPAGRSCSAARMTNLPSFFSSFAAAAAAAISLSREASQFRASFDDDGRGVFLLEDVLRETSSARSASSAFIALSLVLSGSESLRAGAHEILVVTLEQVFRFGIESEFFAIVVERFDALKSGPFNRIASCCAASFGAISFSIFCRAGLVFAPVRLEKMRSTRSSSSPVFSSATIVFSKVGGAGLARSVRSPSFARPFPFRRPAQNERP